MQHTIISILLRGSTHPMPHQLQSSDCWGILSALMGAAPACKMRLRQIWAGQCHNSCPQEHRSRQCLAISCRSWGDTSMQLASHTDSNHLSNTDERDGSGKQLQMDLLWHELGSPEPPRVGDNVFKLNHNTFEITWHTHFRTEQPTKWINNWITRTSNW